LTRPKKPSHAALSDEHPLAGQQEALSWMRSHGEETGDEDITCLSSLMHGHINMLGYYTFTLPVDTHKGEMRTLNLNNELFT